VSGTMSGHSSSMAIVVARTKIVQATVRIKVRRSHGELAFLLPRSLGSFVNSETRHSEDLQPNLGKAPPFSPRGEDAGTANHGARFSGAEGHLALERRCCAAA